MNATSVDELRKIISTLDLDAECKAALQATKLDRANGMTDELKNALKDTAGFRQYLATNRVAK